MTLSAIQFDLEAVDVVVVKGALLAGTLVKGASVEGTLVAKVTVDCSLIEMVSSESIGCAATAAVFTETISAPVAAISFR